MTRDIRLNGASLRIEQHFRDENKPTLVFLHDSLGCIRLWRDFPQRLSEATGCNLLIYDRQGYGESSAFSEKKRTNVYLEEDTDHLERLLEKCGIHDAILFGHSDGGSIALIAAAKYPSRISGIISVGAHIFVEEITLNGIRDAVEAYHSTNLKQRLEKYHGDKTEGVFRAWTQTWLSDAFRSWNIEHFLPGISCPVLAIQGELDEFGSLDQVNGILDQVSGSARKSIVAGQGHTPHKKAPDQVLDTSARFIREEVLKQAL